MKKKIAVFLMLLGVLCISFAMVLLVHNNNENKVAKESSEYIMNTIRLSIAEKETEEIVIDPFDEEMKVERIDDNGYIGYLTIPSLYLDLPVMSECDYEKLEYSPCRYYGSTKTNNLVIAAHNYRDHFGYLGELYNGDTVIFTDMDGIVYKYKVESVEILLPTDVDKVKDSGNDLILYTCTYSGSRRVVVRCNYI